MRHASCPTPMPQQTSNRQSTDMQPEWAAQPCHRARAVIRQMPRLSSADDVGPPSSPLTRHRDSSLDRCSVTRGDVNEGRSMRPRLVAATPRRTPHAAHPRPMRHAPCPTPMPQQTVNRQSTDSQQTVNRHAARVGSSAVPSCTRGHQTNASIVISRRCGSPLIASDSSS